MKNATYIFLVPLLILLTTGTANAKSQQTANDCSAYVSKLAKCEKFACASYHPAAAGYVKRVIFGLSNDICKTYEETAYGGTIVYLSCKLNPEDRKDLVSFYRIGPNYDNGKSYSDMTKPGEKAPFQDIPSQLLQRKACIQEEEKM